MMATTMQEILERYEHEHASTHAVIAAMPDAHASFRPHERSLSWAQLAWHVATTPLYYVSEVFKLPTRSGWDLDSAKPPTTTAALVQALDDFYQDVVDALGTKDDAWVGEMSDYHGQMKENRWILGHVIDHEIHHRGQMTVLLRLKDASVPMVYGPTADECNEIRRFRHHLLVCTGPRCTVNGQSEALFKLMARRLKDHGLDQGMNAVRQTRCNCFLVCSGGPVVVVYPDNVWYRKVSPELLDRIITEHLKDGKPVQEHVYHQG
jgi:(2Fe-2S) ferredoxin/uncharacterized damage-inducible protein DinB